MAAKSLIEAKEPGGILTVPDVPKILRKTEDRRNLPPGSDDVLAKGQGDQGGDKRRPGIPLLQGVKAGEPLIGVLGDLKPAPKHRKLRAQGKPGGGGKSVVDQGPRLL